MPAIMKTFLLSARNSASSTWSLILSTIIAALRINTLQYRLVRLWHAHLTRVIHGQDAKANYSD